jgi:hypothetical protein
MRVFTKKKFQNKFKVFYWKDLNLCENTVVKIKIILQDVHSNNTYVNIFVSKETFLRKLTFHFAEQLNSTSHRFGKTRETTRLTYAVQKTKELRAALRFAR